MLFDQGRCAFTKSDISVRVLRDAEDSLLADGKDRFRSETGEAALSRSGLA